MQLKVACGQISIQKLCAQRKLHVGIKCAEQPPYITSGSTAWEKSMMGSGTNK